MLDEVIFQQKKERDKLLTNSYIQRDQKLNTDSGLINVVVGPRRAGKSFFCLHSLKNEHFGYVNFDDERLTGIPDYDEILNAIDKVYSNPQILFFDEIQNLPKWELFVNRLQRNGRKIVLTGSNSNLLSGELSSYLTGRNYPVNIFPFSFVELLNVAENKSKTEQKKILSDLLNTGGYPEIVTKGIVANEYLSMLFRDTIYKDIVLRYKPRDPAMVEKLALTLVSNAGNEISIRALSKLANYNERTVSRYLAYLLNTMIFFQIPRFSYKLKEQLKSNKKTYVIDNGFIESIGHNVSYNRGAKLENLVAIELYRRALSKKVKIFYWKKNYEVDFVLQNGNKVYELIQVSADVSNQKTANREKRALFEAAKELNCNNLTIITEDYSGVETFEWFGTKKDITFVSIIDWLFK